MSIGETLHNLNELIFVKNKKITSFVGIVVILIAVYAVFTVESNLKKDEMLDRQAILNLIGGDISAGGGGSKIPGTEDYTVMSEITSEQGSLITDGADEKVVTASSVKIISKITASVTWKDEEDIQRIRLYENQPDTFSVSIEGPDGSVLDKAESANSAGGTGTATASHIFTDEDMETYFNAGNYTIIVVLEGSGSYEPRAGLSLIVLTDGKNDYDISINVEYLAPPNDE